jgi:aryl-phospho-beta-D-glucosidase BglC (GH1 family)
LTAVGPTITDGSGKPIILRGVNLGGWMLHENFLLGHPSTEKAVRDALRLVLGEERYQRFSERLLASFYGDADAAYLASLGFNCVRIPVNYRHLEDDAKPFSLKPEGLRHLDRAIAANARHGIYSIIDLHAAQGWQNRGWHSDNRLLEPLTWDHPHFQQRITWLWREFATRYRDEPWVAGYDLLNEPDDPSRQAIGPFYRRLIASIREIDPHHHIIVEGNSSAVDGFAELGVGGPGIVYSIHLYPVIGAAGPVPYPGLREGKYWDRAAVEAEFLERSAWIRERGAPILVGEFGPADEGDAALFDSRIQLLRDQLQDYATYGASWTYWTYKDLGISGFVKPAPDSPWTERLGAVIAKKHRLAADIWGIRPEAARDVQGTLADLLDREFPEDRWKPYGTAALAWHLVAKLMSELLVEEFVSCFAGLPDDELDALADSWRLEDCTRRTERAEILAAAAAGSRPAT